MAAALSLHLELDVAETGHFAVDSDLGTLSSTSFSTPGAINAASSRAIATGMSTVEKKPASQIST